MKITFKELEPQARGNSNGMLLKGTKDYDGSDYEKFYFDTTQQGDETPIHKIAKTLKPGQLVELTYDQSKFKNLETITILDSSEASASDANGGGGAAPAKRGGGGGYQKNNKGNFRDPDHTDRSSAVYLAWEIVKNMEGISGDHKVPAKAQGPLMTQFQDLAKTMTAFIQTGDFVIPNGTTAPDTKVGEREPGSDDQAGAATGQPADGQDDDIPF